MVAGLLDEGTTRRSAGEIAQAIDQVGGTIQTAAEWDHSYAEVSVLTDHTDLAFDLLSDIVIHPAFMPPEVERIRKQTLSALEVVRDDPDYLADAVFRRIVFRGTTYSHPEDGSKQGVERLTPVDLRDFHTRYYTPANSILAVVGDISPEAAFAGAEKYFGSWQGVAGSRPIPPTSSPSAARQIVVIDKPDAVQTQIRIGNLGIARTSPDYYALSVANQILGGPAANRLFRALRSREGLTYGASSDLVFYRSLGEWVAKTFTRTSETVKSVEVALQQIKRLRSHPISEEELQTAKDYLVGHRALELETSQGIASQVLDLMLYDLPLDYWNQFPERIQAIQAKDVWEATRRYLDQETSVIVLVGDTSGFRKGLQELGASRVIPFASVHFASDDLEPVKGAAAHD
jgi:zinc protease